MNKFFSVDFWFNINAGALEPKIQNMLVAGLLILLILAVIVTVIKKQKKNSFYYKILNSLQVFFIVNSVIGSFLLFFTFERVLFLSSRFWFLIWFASMVLWLNFIRSAFLKIPKIQEKVKKEESFNKYIP